jgi:predicted O-linked N-acetylglucosamine transferase (SPINDLY family)
LAAGAKFETALALHRAGRLLEAEHLYREVLQTDPDDAEATFLLGVIAKAAGELERAVDWFEQAIRLAPDRPAFHSDLGDTYRRLQRYAPAVDHLVAASRLRSDLGEPIFNLGAVMQDVGEWDAAVRFFERAALLKPGFPAIERALERARIERESRAPLPAAAHRAPTQNLPAEVWHRLAALRWEQGSSEDAVALLRDAMARHPTIVATHKLLAETLVGLGRVREAVACLEEAAVIAPDDPAIMVGLVEAFLSTGAISGRIDEAVALLRRCLQIREVPIVRSVLLQWLNYHADFDDRMIGLEAREWDRLHGAPLPPWRAPAVTDFEPERRLRIGYVSAHFSYHAHRFFLSPLFANHDPRVVEVFCYANVARPDEETRRFQSLVPHWRDTSALDDDAMAALVREDGIDILVDLEMHAGGNRLSLFARKPAPIQMCWLAYPGTTGLSAMDYRITDPILDPPGADEGAYTERSLRLADSYWCYDPLEKVEESPLPCDSCGYVTFGCLNDHVKLNPQALEAWGHLLRQVEGSKLVLSVPPGETRQLIRDALGSKGVSEERVQFLDRVGRVSYLRAYHNIDICLDPFPYGGHTTSLDSFWMGVPVVTLLAKSKVVGRGGASIASNLGVTELVATSPEEYVRIAADLAHDRPRLRDLRSSLRGRMERSPLMDAPRFARNMERLYRDAWRSWCASPDSVPARTLRADALLAGGRIEEAIACLQEASFLAANDPAHTAAVLIHLVKAFMEAGRVEESVALLRRCLEIREIAEVRSLLLHTLNYDPGSDDALIALEARKWDELHGTPLRPTGIVFVNDRQPDRRLRIGYVSAHVNNHVHLFYLNPLFANHDHRAFEIFCYSCVERPDKETDRLRSLVDQWRDVSTLDDDALAVTIRQDGIDILLDLEMHSATNRLPVFARKPAPIQMCWLAYPGTTGLSAIDYRITDANLEEGRPSPFIERPLILPDTFWCYDPRIESIDPGPVPSDASGHITFGCLNHFVKLNDALLEVWSRVLRRVADSRIALLVPHDETRAQVARSLAELGVERGRIEFIGRLPRAQYLARYQSIDISLDPFPCGGHTTGLDALWMGVPVVTLNVPDKIVGRAGLCFAKNLDLGELVASHVDEYVDIAVSLAGDRSRLQRYRAELRRRMEASPLMDGRRFARNMESLYRHAWLDWCRSIR